MVRKRKRVLGTYTATVFVEDISTSMQAPGRIDAINAMKPKMLQALSNLSVGVRYAEVNFGSDACVVQDFDDVPNVTPQQYAADGGNTNLSAGVAVALDLLEGQKEYFKKNQIPHRQPVLIVASDGEANRETVPGYDARVRELVERNKLTVIPIAVGELGAYPVLEWISPKCTPVMVNTNNAASVDWDDLLQLLSQSIDTGSTEAIQALAASQARQVGLDGADEELVEEEVAP